MLTRRGFCLGAMAGALGLRAFAQEAGLRTITYNVLQCSGWPKDKAKARLDGFEHQLPARYAMELALYRPDIVTFQECPPEETVKAIADLLEMNYVFFPSGERWPGALLTSYEIVSSQNHPTPDGKRPDKLYTRHWGKALLRAPGGEEYIVHSAHLHPSSKEIREEEVTLMLESMKAEIESSANFILQGDLNHEPDQPSYRRWMQAGLVDCYAKTANGFDNTFSAGTPWMRIDYIWVNEPLSERVNGARALYEGAFRLNDDDDVAFALSDHLPVMADFD